MWAGHMKVCCEASVFVRKKNMCSILKASKLPKKLMAEHPTNDGRYGRTWNFWNFLGIFVGCPLGGSPHFV